MPVVVWIHTDLRLSRLIAKQTATKPYELAMANLLRSQIAILRVEIVVSLCMDLFAGRQALPTETHTRKAIMSEAKLVAQYTKTWYNR